MSEWKYLSFGKPPYFELVLFRLSEESRFCETNLAMGALIPGSVFDEFHQDFYVDDTISDEYDFEEDIISWCKIPPINNQSPRVSFSCERGVYSFTLIMTPARKEIG